MISPVQIHTTGQGYEYLRAREDSSEIPHHRVLGYAWGELDSPFFSEDGREIHHLTGVRWLNFERELVALEPAEHRERDAERRQISAAWDRGDA